MPTLDDLTDEERLVLMDQARAKVKAEAEAPKEKDFMATFPGGIEIPCQGLDIPDATAKFTARVKEAVVQAANHPEGFCEFSKDVVDGIENKKLTVRIIAH